MNTAVATRSENGTDVATQLPNLNIAPQSSATVEFVRNIESYWRLANMLVLSGVLPKITKPEAAMAIMLKAHEIGIPAMYAFANLHFFDGKLVESAALMVGMAAERCGVTYEVVSWNDEKCELLFSRPGWSKPLPSSWTIEDARRAGLLGKDNWKKYPKAMLLARAQAQGVRAIAPDRFAGSYAHEEMVDMGPPPVLRAQSVAAALDAGDESPQQLPAGNAIDDAALRAQADLLDLAESREPGSDDE